MKPMFTLVKSRCFVHRSQLLLRTVESQSPLPRFPSSYLRLSPPPIQLPFSRMSEQPFRPREEILEKQKLFQSIQKHTYLKGRMDKVTSVAIPIALAASSLFLIGRGVYNMSHGIGKKE